MTIDWANVDRVLVVKLRSIGDTVLATPSLFALRRLLPDAQIDILLEDRVAPLLDGSDLVHEVLSVGSSMWSRLRMAGQLRRRRYDVAFNLHGGTTATFFVGASGAQHRVGFSSYQYSFVYNQLQPSAAQFWGTANVHSAEQQLALLGGVGVPVEDRPLSRLSVTKNGMSDRVIAWHRQGVAYALLHPGTAFFTKQWPPVNFARTAEFLASQGLEAVAIGSKDEARMLEEVQAASRVPITLFDDLSLPEITALASRARIFVGNDSGIAHIAAAVRTPSVVIFGSSNRVHWRPWTDAPYEVVYREFECQPCPGYECAQFGDARCITSVSPEGVFAAIERVLSRS